MDTTNAGIELNQIADLPTQVATTGSLRGAEIGGDQIFEFTIGIVILTGTVWR